MWKLLNKLFNYQYIQIKVSSLHIRRIRELPNNEKYVDWADEIWILNQDGTFKNSPYLWEPLTFKIQ